MNFNILKIRHSCFLVLFFFFFGSFLYAQKHNIKLDWKNKEIKFKGILQRFPEFNNSIHLSEYDFLPVFRKNFYTNSNNCNVFITK